MIATTITIGWHDAGHFIPGSGRQMFAFFPNVFRGFNRITKTN